MYAEISASTVSISSFMKRRVIPASCSFSSEKSDASARKRRHISSYLGTCCPFPGEWRVSDGRHPPPPHRLAVPCHCQNNRVSLCKTPVFRLSDSFCSEGLYHHHYREIFPHAVHCIVLSKLYDAPLCTEPFYILFIAEMIILILCLSVPYRASGIRDNPAKHEGIILQYFVVYSVLA